MKKLIKLFICGALFMICSVATTSCSKNNKTTDSNGELVNSIVDLALEDAEIRIDDYIDINYFANLKETTSIMIDNIQSLSTKVENEETSDSDINEIQYDVLTTSITNIFNDLSDEEYDVLEY